uniref:Uncharacterized protein n=1 Tax=Anguilla anguilla TaxID=7936 RepID=A0A0E9XRG4_ANGAN
MTVLLQNPPLNYINHHHHHHGISSKRKQIRFILIVCAPCFFFVVKKTLRIFKNLLVFQPLAGYRGQTLGLK